MGGNVWMKKIPIKLSSRMRKSLRGCEICQRNTAGKRWGGISCRMSRNGISSWGRTWSRRRWFIRDVREEEKTVLASIWSEQKWTPPRIMKLNGFIGSSSFSYRNQRNRWGFEREHRSVSGWESEIRERGRRRRGRESGERDGGIRQVMLCLKLLYKRL